MRFLSTEWLSVAGQALAAAAPAPAARFRLRQTVGERSWDLTFVDGSVRLDHPVSDDHAPDMAFAQSAETAAAIATGTSSAHAALLRGEVRFDGDPTLAIEQREVFEWLEQTLAPVMQQTTFD